MRRRTACYIDRACRNLRGNNQRNHRGLRLDCAEYLGSYRNRANRFTASGFPAPAGYQLYRAGRSITITPAVGEGNRRVVVRFYARTCSETYSTANPIVSPPRQIEFIREPTITVSNVPASVNCGEVIAFTPTATVNQPVGVSFAYSVPSYSS